MGDLIERLRKINRDYDLARGIHLTVSKAADRLTALEQENARLREALKSIKAGTALGEAEFRRKLGDRSRPTWFAVNELQLYLAACAGSASAALSGEGEG